MHWLFIEAFFSFQLLFAIAALYSPENKNGPNLYLATSGASHNEHNNLYLYSYHIGAGLSDAVLTSDITLASSVRINGSQVQFDNGTPFPWGLTLHLDNNYAGQFLIPLK